MLKSATFDPVWPEFTGMRLGLCNTPCLTTFSQAFKRVSRPRYRPYKNFQPNQIEKVLQAFFGGVFAYYIHNQVYYKH